VRPNHDSPGRVAVAPPAEFTSSLSLFAAKPAEASSIKISGIVHDFNNMLAIILTHTTIALNKLPIDSPARSHLERAVRTSRRTAELSNQLLADMKNRRTESAMLDLNQVILETVDLLNPRLTPKAQIALNLVSDLNPVLGNDSQLQQVIMNLLLNAADAIATMPGHIAISTANLNVPEARHEVANQPPPGDYVCLQVADDGLGMDQSTVDRIFEPYYTTKPTGTGIGLTTTMGIIHAHRGGIQVFSKPGHGTTFRVLLPAVVDEEF
jgi:two-component system, cell cycle sensor histidine kinase and response regulator CckA